MTNDLESVLATLYAPGIGQASTRNWPAVVRALRRADGAVPACEILARAGLSFETLLLDGTPRPPIPGLLTAVDPQIAALWPLVGRIARGAAANAVEISLDAPLLPPAVWASGVLPTERRAVLAGIGCRRASVEALAFARAVGAGLAERGNALVSGGADGCDAAFAIGHGAATVLLPHGLHRPRELEGAAARISPFAREAGFTRERAMRRNALIVAAADLTLVASARLKEGGSWHAALGAIRRRAPVTVYIGKGAGSGAQALVALGALPVRDPEEALAALDLARTLGTNDDLPAHWAALVDTPDCRTQPPLTLA